MGFRALSVVMLLATAGCISSGDGDSGPSRADLQQEIDDAYAKGFNEGHAAGYDKGYEDGASEQEAEISSQGTSSYGSGVQGGWNLTATANGRATRNFPEDHRSSSGAFVIRGGSTGDEDKSLVKFDLAPLDAKTISSACLWLHRLDADAHVALFDIRAFADNSWTEEGLTWASMDHDAAGEVFASASVGEAGYPPDYGIVEANVTAHVSNYAGKGVTFLLEAESDTSPTSFHGRTNPHPPTLAVNKKGC